MRSEVLHEWIRSGGILIAAAWGVYTFVWKDILVPSWQPAHLNLEASLTPVSDRPATAEGLEMTLDLKGSNSSSRRVYLLSNVWSLSSITRESRPAATVPGSTGFQQESVLALQRVGLQHAERGVISLPGRLLAVGRLFDDEFIDPGGSVSRTILVRIPRGYAAAELRVIMPLLTRRPEGLFRGQRITWGLQEPDDGMPMLQLCSASADQPRSPFDCKAFDETDDQILQRFDPKKSTITLFKQIGLPLSSGQRVPQNGAKP
ncbi:MAG: hypothetical protein DCF23_12055 [Cyanobium sp.]|nr:MAG: hypothetical protein DCF23_12055 [Cyanobium sp.]